MAEKTPLRNVIFGQKTIMTPIKVASPPGVEWNPENVYILWKKSVHFVIQ